MDRRNLVSCGTAGKAYVAEKLLKYWVSSKNIGITNMGNFKRDSKKSHGKVFSRKVACLTSNFIQKILLQVIFPLFT